MAKNKLTTWQYAFKNNWEVLQLLAFVPAIVALMGGHYSTLLYSASVIALALTVAMAHRLKMPKVSIEAAKHAACFIVVVHFYDLVKTSADGLNWSHLTTTMLVLMAFACLLYNDYKEYVAREQ